MDSLTKKIIDYYYRQEKNNKKSKLTYIFNMEVRGITYIELVNDLAKQGYEIKFIKANTKDTIQIGLLSGSLKEYSYYELKQTTLRQEIENQVSEILTLKNKIRKLEIENELLNKNKKAGQKSFDNEDIIKKIFESYESGKSLGIISEQLNNNNIKTKRGGKWYKSTVKFILENKEYVKMGYVSEYKFKKINDKLKRNKIQ
jgi:hypothetical protein